MNLQIEHQCPQCGAPVVLEETDRLLSCDFCRVKSYLMPKRFYRYLLPNAAPREATLFHAPYWRFKGMLFSTVLNGVKHRFVDVSRQAIPTPYIPASLGLRSQALKLKFVTPETPGVFLNPVLPSESLMTTLDERFGASLPKPVYHQAHIGETLSLIYAPLYLKNNRLVDAVLNKPVSPALPEDFDIHRYSGGKPNWPVDFLATLCPQCGWDLHGQRDSLALLCNNCDTIWKPAKGGLKQIPFAHLRSSGKGSTYLPFWRINADVHGIELRSYADLVKTANLPKVPRESWKDIAFRFWVPAFKVRPRNFVHLARNMTLSQPQDELVRKIPGDPLYPVNLPLKEAAESIKTGLASFMKPPRHMLPRLPDITVEPKRFLLVYVPFKEGHHEFIHSDYRLSINKNLLSLSKNL